MSDDDFYVLDACVLYPVIVRDLLLTAAALAMFTPIWSDQIIDEMRRNILADRPDVEPQSIDRMIAAMSGTFPDANTTGYEHLIETLDNDPKDRHVSAAAVHRQATGIVTYNVRDFRGFVLPSEGIQILTPPELVQRWLEDDIELTRRVVTAMAKRKVRPPVTAEDVLGRLARQTGFATVAERLAAEFSNGPNPNE